MNTSTTTSTSTEKTTDGRSLADHLRVLPCVHLPGTPEYDAAVAPWNVAVPVHPIAVVVAPDAAAVVAAVRFGNRHHVQVSVQATGHGAVADLDGALLVSTSGMLGVEVHPEQGWVRTEAGVTWAQVLEAGAPFGLAGLAGSAPGVGVVGYTTGGGLGPLARTYGLASDRVRAFEVVTGDGDLHRVTRTEHPDLFWGLRGGKGILGIVTAVEFDLLQISEIFGGAIYFDGSDTETVLRCWAGWCDGLPPEASTSVALLRLPALPGVPPPLAGRLSVAVRFAWVGPVERGAEVLAPVRAAAEPLIDTVDTMPYAALGSIHADPVDPMPSHETAGLLRELPPAAVSRLLELAGPDAECPQLVVELRQLRGAVTTRDREPSAVPSRDAAFSLLGIGLGVPPVVEAVATNGLAIMAAMEPWAHEGGLPNFAPRSDAAWLHRVYGPATLARLRQVSAAYDPRCVLLAAQVLRSTTPVGS